MGGGGTKMVENFVILRGKVVKGCGSGMDSIRVTLSRGRVERRVGGRSIGEQATRTCRRWQFDV
jgi:hypothetical protein